MGSTVPSGKTAVKKLVSSSVKSVVFDLRYFSDEDIRLIHQAKTNNWTTVQVTHLGLNQQEVDYTIDASIDKMFPYSKEKKVLNGPDYAILHHKFRHFHKVKRKYRGKIGCTHFWKDKLPVKRTDQCIC